MQAKDAPAVVGKGRAVRGALPLPINVHEREQPLAEDSQWADIQPSFSSQGTSIRLVVWGRSSLLLKRGTAMRMRSYLPPSIFFPGENQGRSLGKYIVGLNEDMLYLGLSLGILESNYNQVVSFELAVHHRLRMKGYVEVGRARRKPPEGTGKWIVPRELICQGGPPGKIQKGRIGNFLQPSSPAHTSICRALPGVKRSIRTNKG
ncbi:hypothetical protein HDV62DRAFT_322042 [Trichoderma sp. SZMC 28011]